MNPLWWVDRASFATKRQSIDNLGYSKNRIEWVKHKQEWILGIDKFWQKVFLKVICNLWTGSQVIVPVGINFDRQIQIQTDWNTKPLKEVINEVINIVERLSIDF